MVPPISRTPAKPNSQDMKEAGQTKKMLLSEYEQSREERIKQNLERMQKLGIFDLSLKLKSLKPAPPNSNPSSTRRNHRHFSASPPPRPIRRSSRLQNATPVSYSEVHLTKEGNPLENGHDLLREEGSRPEVYTEEHEKLLGSTEMSWTLFVDGFGKDGKRIYDPVNGKTCHQCRQKTLGHRTHCSKCNKVQGQFCGDCLYMRYGEHVLEANQNPNWICPVCRDICNCSLCRQSKGWPPTGSLYRKITSLGFKSVAHYLVQTRRLNSDLETNSGTKLQTSVKRSLPFSDVEEILIDKISSESNVRHQGLECPQSEGKMTDDCLGDDGKQEESANLLNNKQGDGKSELIMQPQLGKIAIKKASSESNVKSQGLEYPQSEGKMTYNCLDDGKQKKRTDFLNSKQGEGEVERNSELLMQDELATNCDTENSLLLSKMGKEIELHVCSNIRWESSVECLTRLVLPKSCFDEKGTSETESTAEDLKDFGQRHLGCFIAPQSSTMSSKKHGHTSELPDSIAGRLRQRRKTGKEHEEEMSTGKRNGTADIQQKLNNKNSPPCKAEATVNHSNLTTSDVTPVAVTDSIAGRLRHRRNQGNQYEEQRPTGAKDGNPEFKAEASLNHTISNTPPDVAPITRSSSNKKRVRVSEPSPDSIAGRLRQRRAEVKVM